MPKIIRTFLCAMSAIGRGAPNNVVRVLDRVLRTPGSTFLLDGGTGEELFTKIPDDRKIWAATAVVNEHYHGALKDVHRSFLKAGAQAITTVYGIVPGVGFTDDEIVRFCAIAGRLAREVIEEEKSSAFVFGSLGALVESYRADMILDHDRGTAVYQKSARALAAFTDAFLAETLSCVEEAFQVIEAVKNVGQPLLVSFTVDQMGNLRSGEEIVSSFHRVVAHCKDHKVKLLAVLVNCSEPESISKSLHAIRGSDSLTKTLNSEGILLGAYANRLTPVDPNWTMSDSEAPQPLRTDVDPAHYCTDFVSHWVALNVKIVGGCCGISPEHIAYISEYLRRKSKSSSD